jgi:hypothetical protein
MANKTGREPHSKKIEPQRKTTFAARVLSLHRFLKLKQK